VRDGLEPAVAFDHALFDTDHLFDASQPTRLTAPVSGVHLAIAEVGWATRNDLTSAGSNRACDLLASDTPVAREQQPPSTDTSQSLTSLVPLSAGGFVELGCNHDNQQPLAMVSGGDARTSLALIWIAPGR
jgi:hypothetical protein